MPLVEIARRLFAHVPAKPTLAGLVIDDHPAAIMGPVQWERVALVGNGTARVIGDEGSHVTLDGRPLRLTVGGERQVRIALRMQRRRFVSLLREGTLDIEVRAPGTPFRRRAVALIAFVAMSALGGWFVGSVLVMLFGSNPRPLPRALWPVLYGTLGLFAALFGGMLLWQRHWAWSAWRWSVASMRFTGLGVTARTDDGSDWSSPWEQALASGPVSLNLRPANGGRTRRFTPVSPLGPAIVQAARAVFNPLSREARRAQRVRDGRRILVITAILMAIGVAALWWINRHVPGTVPYSAYFVSPLMPVPFAVIALLHSGKLRLPRRLRRR